MDFKDNKSLKKLGFTGFMSISELWKDKTSIPKLKGVYLVINPNFKKTELISPGVGGFFKGKDPNVSIDVLKQNLVLKSQVVYIGKAGGSEVKATLHSRLGQYLSFGQSKKVGHAGGRYIWQIKNHPDLVICWKATPTEEPVNIERGLINKFKQQFGKMPFANLI